MKKLNYLIGLGFYAASLGTVSAQTVIAKIGFEDADKNTKSSCEYALTPGKSQFGDWVNVKDADQWTEQSKDDVFNGEYSFQAQNSDEVGQTWDRGFKIANLPIKENTPYRVSFWVKANSSYLDENGNDTPTKITSWLSQGVENFDKSICTENGTNFGLNAVEIGTDEWRHMSYVVYYANTDALMKVVDTQSWVGNAVFPEQFGGDGAKTYKEFFGGKLPEKYFFIANMNNPTLYNLDDIVIEEGVTVQEVTFNSEAIKVNFGYDTNIADLAKAKKASVLLDTKSVTVTRNGEPVEVESVECQEDGFMYIFFPEGVELDTEDKVQVSFTPSAECPVMYKGDKRPSADATTEMQILGFANETCYYDENIDALPSNWSPATIKSSTPDDGSFDLEGLTEVSITYNKPLDIKNTTATLFRGKSQTELTEISLSEDKCTITVKLPSNMADGKYRLVLDGVMNEQGVDCEGEQSVTFSIGDDGGTGDTTEAYALNMEGLVNSSLPFGVSGNGDDAARVGDGTSTYGGAPRIMGGNDNANQGIYWCQRGGTNNPGEVSFGKAYLEDNQYPGIQLEPGTWVLQYKNAGWDGNADGTYNVAVKDQEGNAIFSLEGVKNTEVVGQGPDASVAISTSTYEFEVEDAGYYYIEFTVSTGWGGQLLTALSLTSKPTSEAAYYKGILAAALDDVKPVVEASADEEYNGETKTAFLAAVEKGNTEKFHSGIAVNAFVKELKDLATAMQTRIDNLDNTKIGLVEAETSIEELEGKYKSHPSVADVEKLLKEYGQVNLTALSDKELNELAANVKNAKNQVAAIKNTVDLLTWGAIQAGTEAQALGADALNAFELSTDDREAIALVNANTKGALYAKIAAGEDLTPYMTKLYDKTQAVEEIPVGEEDNYDEEGHPVIVKGINLSGYIANAHLYRVQGNDGCPGWTITAGAEDATQNIAFSATPSDENPVVDAQINIYGNADYDFSQEIENLPAGIYTVVLQTRTPKVGPKDVEVDGETQSITYYYNAQDEEGTWDKYIYAKGEGEQTVAPYIGAGGLTETYLNNVTVKDGKLTIGAHEHYVSGKAVKHEDNTPQDFWTGTTYVDYANIYWVAPLEGFDYAAEATDIVTINSAVNTADKAIYSVTGAKVNKLQKGINIVKVGNQVKKVFIK